MIDMMKQNIKHDECTKIKSFVCCNLTEHPMEDYPIDQNTWIFNDLQLMPSIATNRRILN